MVHGYKGGWFTMNPGGDEDASIGDDTTSRFMNYYIKGQDWLIANIGIHGLYYDGFCTSKSHYTRVIWRIQCLRRLLYVEESTSQLE